MFQAYSLQPVATKLPLVVESSTSQERTLFGGTKNGYLVKYTAEKNQQTYGVYVCKNFSKKSVTQLKVVPEHQILIALSDGLITVHDCQQVNFPIVASLQKVKGASFFAADLVDDTTGLIPNLREKRVLCLCVAVRRRILVYYWQSNEFFELLSLPDLTYADNVRSAVWCCGHLALAVRDEYFLLSVFNTDKDIPTGNTKYLFTVGSKSSEPVITPLNDLKIIGLGRDETMVFVTLEGEPAQRTGGYSDIKWSHVPSAVEYDFPFLLAIFPKSIEIRSLKPSQLVQTIELQKPEILSWSFRTCLYAVSRPAANLTDLFCLDASVSLKTNIQKLVGEKQYELALQLAHNVADETNDEKNKRINEIKHLYAFHAYHLRRFELAMDLFGQVNAEVVYVVGLFPDLIPDDVRKLLIYPGPLPGDFTKAETAEGLKSLAQFLAMTRTNIAQYLHAHNLAKKKLFSGENLCESEKKCLLDEQVESQQKTLLQIVDTTLLKCYLQTNEMLVASLIRLTDNSCDVEESEKILLKHNKVYELFLLYERKNMHEAALELLKKQSKLHDSPLKGLARTIRYLQNLDNEYLSLIFQYAKWVLREDQEEGLKIFTEDFDEVRLWNREKVLEFLMRESPKNVVPYLEHVITQWDDRTTKFHQTLMEQLIFLVKKEMNNYLQTLQPNQSMAPAGKEAGDLGVLRAKLLNFLEFSCYYNAEFLLIQLPVDSMYEERALLLGRLHQHKQAIAIYTNILHDYKKAEAYCKSQYSNATKVEDAQVFFTLFSAYAQPPDNVIIGLRYADLVKPKPNVKMALTVLQNYAPYIDTMKALSLLPTTTRLEELWIALEAVLQDTSNRNRDGKLQCSLFYSQYLSMQSKKMRSQDVKILVNHSSICSTCGKKIGISAFARLPDESMVHYYCLSKD